jgi:hypothetical protein
MAQDLDKMVKALEEGIVLVQYEDLRTGETKEREMTLVPENTRGMDARALNDGDKLGGRILMFDVEFCKWADIREDTIINWKKY